MSHRIMAYSDDALLLRGLELELRDMQEFSLTLLGTDPRQLAESVARSKPDVLLVDWVLGVDFNDLRDIRSAAPDTHLILWTRDLPTELAYQAIEIGVRGILLHTAGTMEHRECLLQVASGEPWLDRALTLALLTGRPVNLTRRESQLVELLSRGLKNKEIATALEISEGTVKVYMSRLFEKVGAKDRFELALFGVRHLQRGASHEQWPANGAMSGAGGRTIILRR